MPEKSKIQYLDILRTLATIGVIIIHTSSPVLNMAYGHSMSEWWVGNIFDSASRFAVPLFLMLSGATLLGKEYPLAVFFKKRMMRVLVPFLFWMFVYWVYRWLMLLPQQQPQKLDEIIQWAVKLFLDEGISKHFWYIYMIIFIYLFIPFIGKVVRQASEKQLFFALLAWMLLCFTTSSMNLSFYKWTGDYEYKLLGYLQYSGFVVLGYFLNKVEIKFSKRRLVAGVTYVLSVVFCALAAYYMSKSDGRLNLKVYSYFSINTIIQAVAIFVLIKGIVTENNFLSKICSIISDYSYGIYLVHIIIIGALFRNGIYWSFAHPIVSLPLLLLMVLLSSMIVIFFIRKIPGGKYISG